MGVWGNIGDMPFLADRTNGRAIATLFRLSVRLSVTLCIVTSRGTKISSKSVRGLGHVTSTIFGSTVGYPSDSLASCILLYCLLFICVRLSRDSINATFT